MTDFWQRKREERASKLNAIKQAQKDGELVVRPMTEAERKHWGLPPDPEAMREREKNVAKRFGSR